MISHCQSQKDIYTHFIQDITGKVLDTYHFERLVIHDVAVTQDGQRLLGVGTLLSSGDGLQPSRCRAEKRIICEFSCSHKHWILFEIAAQRIIWIGSRLKSRALPSQASSVADILQLYSQVPVLHDVRHITTARSGHFALVSCDFKVTRPYPQLHQSRVVDSLFLGSSPALEVRDDEG